MQKQREGRAWGLSPGGNISGGSRSSVPPLFLRAQLSWLGEGEAAPSEQSPPLAASPRPLAGTSERGAQVTVTSRGLARPCWPSSFLPSQRSGLTGEDRRLSGLLLP